MNVIFPNSEGVGLAKVKVKFTWSYLFCFSFKQSYLPPPNCPPHLFSDNMLIEEIPTSNKEKKHMSNFTAQG